VFLIRRCIQSYWEIQNRETTHSDPPIVARSSKRAITKSGVPERLHQSRSRLISAVRPRERTHDPQHVPSTIPSPPAEATHAPVNPPNKIRAINPGGAVRLGVFGSLSVTSSTNAKIVKITAAVVVPIQERGLGTFKPAQMRGPGIHRWWGQRSQPGEESDQKRKQQNLNRSHSSADSHITPNALSIVEEQRVRPLVAAEITEQSNDNSSWYPCCNR
jgi:hypothetical protein